jgi:hypothetical protein
MDLNKSIEKLLRATLWLWLPFVAFKHLVKDFAKWLKEG